MNTTKISGCNKGKNILKDSINVAHEKNASSNNALDLNGRKLMIDEVEFKRDFNYPNSCVSSENLYRIKQKVKIIIKQLV